MKCPVCDGIMIPTDSLESPISGEIVSPYYECPNNCEWIEWSKHQNKDSIANDLPDESTAYGNDCPSGRCE